MYDCKIQGQVDMLINYKPWPVCHCYCNLYAGFSLPCISMVMVLSSYQTGRSACQSPVWLAMHRCPMTVPSCIQPCNLRNKKMNNWDLTFGAFTRSLSLSSGARWPSRFDSFILKFSLLIVLLRAWWKNVVLSRASAVYASCVFCYNSFYLTKLFLLRMVISLSLNKRTLK